MMKQKVVIVFPVYNGEKTLISSLRSIADQTFGEFEAIILDNKSVDNTFSLAEQFCRSDRRFSLIRNEQHLSAIENFARAVQIGAERGEYFCLRACDDHSSPDFLARLVEALDENPGKLLAACPTKLVGPSGTRIKAPDDSVFDFTRKYVSGKVPRNLTFPAEWIYGLYRAGAKETLMARWFELGNPWCFASYVVSELVVRDLVVYVDGPTLDFAEGSGSEQRYGAKSFRDRLDQRLKYTLGCYNLTRKLPPVSLMIRTKFFRMCWNDARRKTRYKLLWIF
ncbi:glycosyltransferase family 2 protein [Sinorhizobium meliloti]|uniref:glycosyltransferase family 2 protein n=1 Tax=Rhizobium meliloti TaxID=382 RepID=UPI00299F2E06|nr:glycosyltransferase [Sinorhizobium meliloti]MDX0141371.1 glycosyltransferase [Sinorhizobium meliloti]MDX0384664.1 glycosyltransferase [Sinorhizobium meliloti]UIJ96647.1 glycosyltransferase [Sinorhizobium meliloti]WKL33058.1 glycosyltransferase family 2 protein [Sinorhizobium meliloti]